LSLQIWDTKLPAGKEGEYIFTPQLDAINPANQVSKGIQLNTSKYGIVSVEVSPKKKGGKDDQYSNFSPHVPRNVAEAMVRKHCAEEKFVPELPGWKTSTDLREKTQSTSYGNVPVLEEAVVVGMGLPDTRHFDSVRQDEVYLARSQTKGPVRNSSATAAAAEAGLVLAPDNYLAGRQRIDFQPDEVAAPTKSAFKMKATVASSGYGSGRYVPRKPKDLKRGPQAREALKKSDNSMFTHKFSQEQNMTFKPELHLTATARRLAREEEKKRAAFGSFSRTTNYSPDPEDPDEVTE
jgi:hypothetical protein